MNENENELDTENAEVQKDSAAGDAVTESNTDSNDVNDVSDDVSGAPLSAGSAGDETPADSTMGDENGEDDGAQGTSSGEHDYSDNDGSPTDGPLYGVLAEYESPGALIDAAQQVREAGYAKFDCYSPFPVHGIDRAMGIKRTILPWLVLGGGITGLSAGIGFQWWANGFHWPWIVSGKPFFSLPANIPITFETTVLFAGLTCFFSMWALNKLPRPYHPFFRNDSFKRVTDDGFFLGIEAEDPEFDHQRTAALLHGAGATAVEDCHVDPDPAKKKIPRALIAFILMTAVLAIVPFALIAKARASKSDKPHWHVIPDMDFQPKSKAQTASDFFEDGRSMRLPVEGTVARGMLMSDDHFYKGVVYERKVVNHVNAAGESVPSEELVPQWAETFPQNREFQVGLPAMERGRERYDIFCAPCHGTSGDGQGMVARRAREVPTKGWNAPSDVNVALRQPHGQLYNTINNGVRQMPAYGAQLSPADRWAIVLYVRALQRSQNATMNDVPEAERDQVRQ